MIKFNQKSINASNQYPATFLEVEIEGGIIQPSDLANIIVPDLPKTEGVILSGRCPVWLFSFLSYELRLHVWIATFDPKLEGAVCVRRQSPTAPQIGEVVTLPK